MTTTTKKEDKGAQGATASQTKTNGTTVHPATEKVSVKPKSIEEQMKFFDGLSHLVKTKRVLEKHREVVASLTVPAGELEKFDTEKRYGVGITLHDDAGNEYEVTNPKLVNELQEYLRATIDRKIAEFDQKILLYGN